MPRKPIVRSSEHYYHVVARCNNKDEFYLPLEDVWILMTSKLRDIQKRFKVEIGAFVLMNNHFHLLIMSPESDIDRVMYFFMKELTFNIQKRTGRVNRIFGSRYRGCIIENYRYLLNVYKYVCRNPVAAGICAKAEDYPYSSFLYFINDQKPGFQLSSLCDFNKHQQLDWINEAFPEKEADSMKYGLSKTSFRYKQQRTERIEIIPQMPGPEFFHRTF